LGLGLEVALDLLAVLTLAAIGIFFALLVFRKRSLNFGCLK